MTKVEPHQLAENYLSKLSPILCEMREELAKHKYRMLINSAPDLSYEFELVKIEQSRSI